jgi:hypothetical protein
MLPLVVTAGVLLADLASPVTPEEYAHIMLQQVARHEPLSEEGRAYYLAIRARPRQPVAAGDDRRRGAGRLRPPAQRLGPGG